VVSGNRHGEAFTEVARDNVYRFGRGWIPARKNTKALMTFKTLFWHVTVDKRIKEI